MLNSKQRAASMVIWLRKITGEMEDKNYYCTLDRRRPLSSPSMQYELMNIFFATNTNFSTTFSSGLLKDRCRQRKEKKKLKGREKRRERKRKEEI